MAEARKSAAEEADPKANCEDSTSEKTTESPRLKQTCVRSKSTPFKCMREFSMKTIPCVLCSWDELATRVDASDSERTGTVNRTVLISDSSPISIKDVGNGQG